MMGNVKILPDANLPPIPADSVLCSYKPKPNFLSSTICKQQMLARNTKWVEGERRSKEMFPKTIAKVLFISYFNAV